MENEKRSFPLATSHNRHTSSLNTDLSEYLPCCTSPAARVLPSGLNANEKTFPVSPLRGGRSCPVAMSHIQMRPLAGARELAAARVLPSGLNANRLTTPPPRLWRGSISTLRVRFCCPVA